MRSREEPLTRRERDELRGYVSWGSVATRTVLFSVALAIVGAACRGIQQWLRLPELLWVLPTGAVGLLLYLRSRRWTGGRDLRERIRRDLAANAAAVHHVGVSDAIVFDEREDEGPIVFVLTDAGEALVFLGQELARDVARGFPWREFEIRESASSGRFFGLKRLGEPFPPSAKRPPLSPERYQQLGLPRSFAGSACNSRLTTCGRSLSPSWWLCYGAIDASRPDARS